MTAIEHGLEATAPAQVKPPVKLNSSLPLHVLGDCKKVARKADWSLERWCEFSETARACLDEGSSPEAFERFMRVVDERFAVTRGPKFDPKASSSTTQERLDDD